MITTLVFLVFVVFLFLGVLHFSWAFGSKWGSDAVIPTDPNKKGSQKMFVPGPIPTIVVGLGLIGAGLLVLIRGGLLDFDTPVWMEKYGLWFLVAIFFLRSIGDFKYVGFFKKIKHTPFGINDSRYYSPLCFTMACFMFLIEYFS